MKGWDWIYPLLIGLCVGFLVFVLGYWVGRESAVCHSYTEESTMLDCNYSGGEWRP